MAYPLASQSNVERQPVVGGLLIGVVISLLLWAIIASALFAIV